jgi:hypothetical protein
MYPTVFDRKIERFAKARVAGQGWSEAGAIVPARSPGVLF